VWLSGTVDRKDQLMARSRRGASLIRFHLQRADICAEDRAELAALADHLDRTDDDAAAVWEFAREFARPAGDSPTCQCVSCRAYWAVRDDEGQL
jgi:hypothetical protein